MEILLSTIVQIVSGAIGGNIAGTLKNFNMGTKFNSIAGGVGGLVLSQVVPLLSNGSLLNGLAGEVVAGGGGGLILTAIIGFIRNTMTKKA